MAARISKKADAPTTPVIPTEVATAGSVAKRASRLQKSATVGTPDPTGSTGITPTRNVTGDIGGSDTDKLGGQTGNFTGLYAEEKYVDLKIEVVRGEVRASVEVIRGETKSSIGDAKHEMQKWATQTIVSVCLAVAGLLLTICIAAATWHHATINEIRKDIPKQIENEFSPLKNKVDKLNDDVSQLKEAVSHNSPPALPPSTTAGNSRSRVTFRSP